MKYKLDNAGYVCAVSFGCYLDNCTEYTGAVPAGYNNLDEWASYACIQAYYIDSEGNLVLDYERQLEIEKKQAQEEIDNAPLYRKDLYENDEVLDSQYIRQTATGKVIVLKDIKTIAPRVKITGINPYEYRKLNIVTQCKNMIPCTVKGGTISGVSFTRNPNGSVGIMGKATADIEYIISECDFTLKANENYYLNLGGFNCELRFNDNGEIAQQYIGASGLINVPRNIEVSQVVIKIANGQTVNTTFYPQLEHGESFTSYAEYKCKSTVIDFSEYASFVPSDTLYPSDSIYPRNETTINYILIENGSISISVDGIPRLLTGGVVGLFGSFSTIYANKDVDLELEYSTNLIDVDSLEFLQGKATTTNRFKILKDGSIEAHNGYFSGKIEADSGYFKGRIEADSGYFKGEVSWDCITDKDGVATKDFVEDKGYQNEIQVTKITKDTVTAPYIKTLGLTVGNEIVMGDNAYISWGKITDTPRIPSDTSHLTNGAGYTNTSQVTTITKNTVTTSYINALKVKAGSVDAENITGTTIKGKRLEGISGEIGGFTIGTTGLYTSSATILGGTGVHVGTSGISCASYDRGVTIKSDGSAEFKTYDGVKVYSDSSHYSYVKPNGITIANSIYSATEYTEIGITGRSKYTITSYDGITLDVTSVGSRNVKLQAGTANVYADFGYSTAYIYGGTAGVSLGKSNTKIGFFGNDGSIKKSVSTITSASSATASTVATKLNELINTLKAYNLI